MFDHELFLGGFCATLYPKLVEVHVSDEFRFYREEAWEFFSSKSVLFFSSDYAQLAFVCSHSCEGHFSAIVQHQLVSFLTVHFFQQDVDLDYVAKVTHGFSGADLTEICQRVRSSVLFTTFQDIFAVIHLEIGSNESRDAHSQKLVSPSDKRVTPIQHLALFLCRMHCCIRATSVAF